MNDEISKVIAKVERFARQEQLFAPAEPGRALHLCAAVSGGADSMALLRVLLELREAFGYPLRPAMSTMACGVRLRTGTKLLSGPSVPGWGCR